jgi:hypothetical protein
MNIDRTTLCTCGCKTIILHHGHGQVWFLAPTGTGAVPAETTEFLHLIVVKELWKLRESITYWNRP